MSSHQTAVPLVLSGLLTQTVQLQLVDLQVRPGNKKNPSVLLLFLTQKQPRTSCSVIYSTRPPEPEPCLLTVSLGVRQRTLRPAAPAAAF